MNQYHKYESNIKCPYCNWEDEDSYKFDENLDFYICNKCKKQFNVIKNVEVTYTTYPLSCEQKECDHEYEYISDYIKKRNFENKVCYNLPESEWTYHRVMICVNCQDTKYIDISKEEYDNELNKTN
jgi:hypothetical protein